MKNSKVLHTKYPFTTLLLLFVLLIVLAGCKESNNGAPEETPDPESTNSYQVTEENENPEIIMQNQPIS